MIDLPDVNIWVALSDPLHSGHTKALSYWRNEASSSMVFCRTTALGLTRTLCRKTSPESVPLSPMESWQVYEQWCSAAGVSLAPDPVGVEERLKELIEGGFVSLGIWTDAYLAAFAIAGSLRLVTFDKDFERFPGLDLLRL